MQSLTLRKTKTIPTLPTHTKVQPTTPNPPPRNSSCRVIIKFLLFIHLALIPGSTYQYFTTPDACAMLQLHHHQESTIPPIFHVQSPSVSSALTEIESWTKIYPGKVLEYDGQEEFEDHTHVVWTDKSCTKIILQSNQRIQKIYSTLTQTIQR